MAWSYSGDPSGAGKDAVRFMIQDTNTARQLVQDEEIEWALGEEMNVYMAAARICRILIVKAGGLVNKKISEFSITYDPKIYMGLAASLEARGMNYQVPYCGGISASDKRTQQSDPDWITPAIPRGLDDNASAPSPSTPPTGNQSGNPLTTI